MSKLNYKVRVLTPAEGFHCLSVKQEHGRNDKCPCGSGKKIKNCHAEYLEKKYYSSCPEKEDTTAEERKCKCDKVKIYKELK